MLLPRLGEGRDGEYPVRDFVVTPASEPESPSLGQLKTILSLTIRLTMRLGIEFRVLFGMSENSSFPSTLRAWFAFAHSSPYRKSNRNDKGIGCSPPYPSPSWGGYLANPLPKLRGNRQNAPSPDWGRLG